jgi:hypothetical protein
VAHSQRSFLRGGQLPEITSSEVAELFRLLQPEGRRHASGPGVRATVWDIAAGELALKLTTLETELRGLRQVLTEVKASPDELQGMGEAGRDRRLLERTGPMARGAERRAWFCGRAAAIN